METATHTTSPGAERARDGKSPQVLKLELIRLDGGTQTRASIIEEVVAEYAQLMKDDVAFPPIVVFHDGTDYWLADGFHRLTAARLAGKAEILAEVRSGSCREALLHALGANQCHGLQRSNADKRRAIGIMLADEEWSSWSDREISRRCGTSHHLVAEVRRETGNSPSQRTYRNSQGKVGTMNVAGIGKSRPSDGGTKPSDEEVIDPASCEMPTPSVEQEKASEFEPEQGNKAAEKGSSTGSRMEPFTPPAPPTDVSEESLEVVKAPATSPPSGSGGSVHADHTEEEKPQAKETRPVDECLRELRRGLVLELPDANPKTIRLLLADICTHPKLVPALKRGCLLVRIKKGGV